MEQEKSVLAEKLATLHNDLAAANMEYDRLKREAVSKQEQDRVPSTTCSQSWRTSGPSLRRWCECSVAPHLRHHPSLFPNQHSSAPLERPSPHSKPACPSLMYMVHYNIYPHGKPPLSENYSNSSRRPIKLQALCAYYVLYCFSSVCPALPMRRSLKIPTTASQTYSAWKSRVYVRWLSSRCSWRWSRRLVILSVATCWKPRGRSEKVGVGIAMLIREGASGKIYYIHPTY